MQRLRAKTGTRVLPFILDITSEASVLNSVRLVAEQSRGEQAELFALVKYDFSLISSFYQRFKSAPRKECIFDDTMPVRAKNLNNPTKHFFASPRVEFFSEFLFGGIGNIYVYEIYLLFVFDNNNQQQRGNRIGHGHRPLSY